YDSHHISLEYNVATGTLKNVDITLSVAGFDGDLISDTLYNPVADTLYLVDAGIIWEIQKASSQLGVTTPSVHVEKLVSDNHGTDWWLLGSSETPDEVSNVISALKAQGLLSDASHFHTGTPTLLHSSKGAATLAPEYAFVVTNTGDADLTNVTLTDN